MKSEMNFRKRNSFFTSLVQQDSGVMKPWLLGTSEGGAIGRVSHAPTRLMDLIHLWNSGRGPRVSSGLLACPTGRWYISTHKASLARLAWKHWHWHLKHLLYHVHQTCQRKSFGSSGKPRYNRGRFIAWHSWYNYNMYKSLQTPL